jgi:hypothetical protein
VIKVKSLLFKILRRVFITKNMKTPIVRFMAIKICLLFTYLIHSLRVLAASFCFHGRARKKINSIHSDIIRSRLWSQYFVFVAVIVSCSIFSCLLSRANHLQTKIYIIHSLSRSTLLNSFFFGMCVKLVQHSHACQ